VKPLEDFEVMSPSPVKFKKSPKTMTSPTLESVVDIVGQELMRLEAERILKVESRIKHHQKRRSLEAEDIRQRSLRGMKTQLAIIEAEMVLCEKKEKEAEANCVSKTDEEFLKQEIEARKSREAHLEAEIQKAKKSEAAKKERTQQLQNIVIQHISTVNQLLETVSAVVPPDNIEASLQPYGLNLASVQTFLQGAAQKQDNLDKTVQVLDLLAQSFTKLIHEAATLQQEEQEQEEQQHQLELQLEQENARLAASEAAAAKQPPPVQPSITNEAEIPKGPGISASSGEILQRLREFRNAYIKEISQIDISKEFKFACQKAVTTPLNALSDVSAEHLKDKMNKLVALCQGQPVQASEKTQFQATTVHEMRYAKNLLAKKLVSHGQEVVASKPKNAFAAASIVVALWSQHPDFGQVFLAYLFEACPYLAPNYPQKTSEMSEAEYFTTLGYSISNGVIEDKTMFLKRMTGMTRLYAAVTVSRLPANEAVSKDHPHGLGNIWRLLAATLNLEPLNDISATLLYDILSVTGAFMYDKYGPMFGKLLSCLVNTFFGKIQSVTEEGCGGPLARLELFLKKAITSQTIERPDGLLRADFI
jgi:nucleoporin GLE1